MDKFDTVLNELWPFRSKPQLFGVHPIGPTDIPEPVSTVSEDGIPFINEEDFESRCNETGAYFLDLIALYNSTDHEEFMNLKKEIDEIIRLCIENANNVTRNMFVDFLKSLQDLIKRGFGNITTAKRDSYYISLKDQCKRNEDGVAIIRAVDSFINNIFSGYDAINNFKRIDLTVYDTASHKTPKPYDEEGVKNKINEFIDDVLNIKKDPDTDDPIFHGNNIYAYLINGILTQIQEMVRSGTPVPYSTLFDGGENENYKKTLFELDKIGNKRYSDLVLRSFRTLVADVVKPNISEFAKIDLSTLNHPEENTEPKMVDALSAITTYVDNALKDGDGDALGRMKAIIYVMLDSPTITAEIKKKLNILLKKIEGATTAAITPGFTI